MRIRSSSYQEYDLDTGEPAIRTTRTPSHHEGDDTSALVDHACGRATATQCTLSVLEIAPALILANQLCSQSIASEFGMAARTIAIVPDVCWVRCAPTPNGGHCAGRRSMWCCWLGSSHEASNGQIPIFISQGPIAGQAAPERPPTSSLRSRARQALMRHWQSALR